MRAIVHFQEKIQQPICLNRRLTNTTFNRSEVTCRTCLDKLKWQIKGRPPVDWDGIYRSLGEQLPTLNLRLKEFLFAHPEIQGRAELYNMPPQFWLWFWIPAPARTRKKRFTYNNSRTNDENYIDVLEPSEEQMGVVAMFVSSVAAELSLTPRRNPQHRELIPLSYQIRPRYR